MNSIRLYCIILFFLFTKIIVNGQPVKITINPTSNSSGKLMLNEVIATIEYIPLETTKECLIGDVPNFHVSDNYIVVYSVQSKLFYLFSREGKFISQLGRVGKGPGEYHEYGSGEAMIDEKHQMVIIPASYPFRLLFFDLTGKFRKELPVTLANRTRRFYTLMDDKFLMGYLNDTGNVPYTYEIRSLDYSLITRKIKPVPFNMTKSGGYTQIFPGFCLYLYSNKIHVKEATLNDTLYSVDLRNNTIKPVYLINFGKYETSVEVRKDFYKFPKEMKNYAFAGSAFETDNYLLISYEYDNVKKFGYFDKKAKKFLLFKSADGIPNNYDGGLDFWPQKQYNKMLVAVYNAYPFAEKTREVSLEGPGNAVEFMQKFRKNINPEANPVVVIVTLK